jgi:hypothetical protein
MRKPNVFIVGAIIIPIKKIKAANVSWLKKRTLIDVFRR